MYTRPDIDLVLRIKKLLYEEEFTIAGARRKLEQEEAGGLVDAAVSEPPAPAPPGAPARAEPEALFRDDAPVSETAKPAEAPAPPPAPSHAERARAAVAETEIAALRKRLGDLEARHSAAAAALEAAGEERQRDRERREKVASRLEALLRSLDGPRGGDESDADPA
jgi:DNA-binding transcriptional MerR regulator